MYLLQVSWRRNIEPERGQEQLKTMMAEVDKAPAGQGRLAVEGVTVHANPFPERLQAALMQSIPGLIFDAFNFNYAARFEAEADAVAASDWVNGALQAWMLEDEKKAGFPVARVLVDADIGELADMETF